MADADVRSRCATEDGLKSVLHNALGFLTVVQDADGAYSGGYLVLNAAGRPIEFHCTLPVKPNRAQQILFGPTLEPYLCGEQIGQTLIQKATTKVVAVCSDRQALLAARPLVAPPVAWLVPAEGEKTEGNEAAIEDNAGLTPPVRQTEPARIDPPHAVRAPLVIFALGAHKLAIDAAHGDLPERVAELLSPWGEHFDLAEPFSRIREAMDEALRGGR
ncbi:MAG: hypothetical protein HYS13_08355 [Planctomycetia bacterium]|nr:hypothetical protein [Planctomycetia bacterium]